MRKLEISLRSFGSGQSLYSLRYNCHRIFAASVVHLIRTVDLYCGARHPTMVRAMSPRMIVSVIYAYFMLIKIGVHCCVTDRDIAPVKFAIDLKYRSDRIAINGSWKYYAVADINWHVTEGQGIDFDGIMYHLGNGGFSGLISESSILLAGGYNGMAPPGLVPAGSVPSHLRESRNSCDAHINKTIWTADENGTALQCRIPCEGIIFDEICYFGSDVCGLLSAGFRALSKDTRNITIPISFGTKYRIELYVYRGWHYGVRQSTGYVESALFCRHELVTKFNRTPEYADAYCGELHEMDPTWYTTGPVRNLRVVSKTVDFFMNQGEVELEWKPPLDIYKLSSIKGYNIFAVNARLAGYNGMHFVPHEPRNGWIKVKFDRMILGKKTYIRVTPTTVSPNCHNCATYGRSSETIKIRNPDINACESLVGQTPFCVSIADCEDVSANDRPAAVCTCPPGYIGNGIDPEYEFGTGCAEYNACSNMAAVRRRCDVHASCKVSPRNSLEFYCSCPCGFVGDGYLTGSGCKYDASMEKLKAR